ncbi:MAG TPA: HAD-IIA family hydrolase [Anaerolineaceae bacterium]|nr:HAD-IIA family hydrolase [Anaerolineaceae bacterium]
MKRLDFIKGVVLDMDGTFYIGNQLLPGSLDLLAFFNSNNIQFSFLTNNSTRSWADYRQKLLGMGVREQDCRIYTSGEATIQYLREHYSGKRVNLMGTRSLAKSFIDAGIALDDENPELLVLAYDTENTYAKLANFCLQVRKGLPYIATHPDINYPDPRGYLPDAGAYIELIRASTGRLPDAVIGKPSAEILNQLAYNWGLQASEVLMVGDRLYTDIQLARNAGAISALVLTGEAKLEDLEASIVKPDFVCADLAELLSQFLVSKS